MADRRRPREPIIRVEDLTAGYDDTVLLENVNFDVQPRRGVRHPRRLGLRQEHAAEAHDRPLRAASPAACCIDGDDIVTAEGAARQAILRKIGVMYQAGALFGSMTLLRERAPAARGVHDPRRATRST